MTTVEQRAGWLSQLTREEPEVNRDVKNDVTKDAEEKKEELWKDDKLERRLVADALATLVKAQRRPFVVSLDGDWGTGKTFFLERWKEHLEIDGLTVIYFNAWKDDFFADPLVPLLAEIMRTTDDTELRKKVSGYLRELAYRNARSLIAKHVGVEMPELKDDITIAYEFQTKTRAQLKGALSELVESLQSEYPIVLIVDELDRCRPDFAVATLERVKHMLDIPGLVFVYGINRRELSKSVESLYGDIDAPGYVRRFFDIDFFLPARDTYTYCDFLAQQYAIPAKIEAARLDDGGAFIGAVPAVLRSLPSLSLRDIEQCVRIAAFAALNLAQGKTHFHYMTIVAVIVIRLINNDLYRRFARREHVAGKMIDFLARHAVGDMSWLHYAQGPLYAISDEQMPAGAPTAHDELTQLLHGATAATGAAESNPGLLADWTRSANKQQMSEVLGTIQRWRSSSHAKVGGGIRLVDKWHPQLVALIELTTRM